MSLFARSDLVHIAVSSDAGGCGQSHTRPVVAGAPARSWELTCPSCETVLRNDAHWATTAHTVPETPDELAIREEAEKRGAAEQAITSANALQELSKLADLPTALAQLAQMFAGERGIAAKADPDLLCKDGHPNKPDSKFCTDCGISLSEPVKSEKSVQPFDPDLESMNIRELQTLARSRGIKTARGKDEQISLLRESA